MPFVMDTSGCFARKINGLTESILRHCRHLWLRPLESSGFLSVSVVWYAGGLLCVAAADLAQDQWPQWRGPTGQGISTTAHPPIEWSEDKNMAWKVALPGKGPFDTDRMGTASLCHRIHPLWRCHATGV